ncbi:MAG: hypothetical protein WA843_04255 [Candidatus Saccharimonadales bacterium]
MSEEQPKNSEIAITMPSELRIRQRLGQISIDKTLIPRLGALGGQTLTPNELLSSLGMELSSYAAEHMLGMTALAYERIPVIIDMLVEDDNHKGVTLSLWETMVRQKKQKDEVSEEELTRLRQRYSGSRGKVPRKQKKQQWGNGMKNQSNQKRPRDSH